MFTHDVKCESCAVGTFTAEVVNNPVWLHCVLICLHIQKFGTTKQIFIELNVKFWFCSSIVQDFRSAGCYGRLGMEDRASTVLAAERIFLPTLEGARRISCRGFIGRYEVFLH
jgi:hypothetical protein